MEELSSEYGHWVKQMQEKGLSYGPADVLIAQLEAENEQLRVDLNNLRLVKLVEMRESGQITRKQFDDCVKALGDREDVSVAANDSAE